MGHAVNYLNLYPKGQYDGCSTAGCYEDEILYENDLDEIISLIEISESCEQNIINNCTGNVLSQMAWWNDRNGNKIEYWDGNHPTGTEGCKCSLDGTGQSFIIQARFRGVTFGWHRILKNKKKK